MTLSQCSLARWLQPREDIQIEVEISTDHALAARDSERPT
jgi:hypothetical protein